MDDFEDLGASKFVTDTDDQDSLDERIDTEQRLRNQQLWASFQNAACCITKLYKDRSQPTVSLWNPFQNAASNLTTLYKDCIESQRRFAKIGYQVGRRKRLRDLKKLLKKHQTQTRQHQSHYGAANNGDRHFSDMLTASDDSTHGAQATSGQQQNNVASILAVNQLNLDCDDSPSHSMQTQPFIDHQLVSDGHRQQQQQNYHPNQNYSPQQQPSNTTQTLSSNNEEDLVTFQQALVQPATVRSMKSGHNKRPYLNSTGYLNSRPVDPSESEEDRLLELNQFLSEEYNRHVGSRKRSCPSGGGNAIKRARE